MTDEPQQEKEEQLTEKEKRLEKKERRRRQANNGHVEGEAAQVNGKAETNKTDKHEIASIFRIANDKIDKIEANAEKEKQQVVRDTAQKLEKYRRVLSMQRLMRNTRSATTFRTPGNEIKRKKRRLKV
jgi:hypothetical protein